MAAPLVARPPYAKRDVPYAFDRGWWQTELGNVQRAIPTYTLTRVTTPLYTPVATDRTILCDTTTGAVSISLQKPERQQGLELIIKKVAGGNPVNIIGTIDGVTNPSLVNLYDSITIQSDGQQWLKLASNP